MTAAVVATTTLFGPSFVPDPVPPPSVAGWHGQISQPTLRKVNNQPSALYYGNFTPAEKDLRWFAPLSQPTLRKVDNQPAAFVSPNFTPRETDLRWYAPLSQPTRRIGQIQPDALVYGFAPSAPSGTDDVRFSVSTTVVPYQRTLLYQSLAYPVQIDTTETITVDKWYAALAQPTYRKPTVHPTALAFAPLPVTVADYRWQQPLSEPTRRKPHYEYPAFFSQPSPLTVENYRWWRPLAEPTRRELRVQPDALSWSTFTPASTEDVTVDKWYAPLHVPMLGIWSPTRMDFTWFPPSGEPGPTPPPTNVQKDGDPDYWKLPWLHLDGESFTERLRHKAITALEQAVDAAKQAEPAKAKRAARKAARDLREYAKSALLSDDVITELGQTASALNYAASQWNRDDLIERVTNARMLLLAYAAMQQDEEDALIALMVAQ